MKTGLVFNEILNDKPKAKNVLKVKLQHFWWNDLDSNWESDVVKCQEIDVLILLFLKLESLTLLLCLCVIQLLFIKVPNLPS